MRAGKMDRSITIQHYTTVIDDYGVPSETWADVATVRAQMIESTVEEYQRAYGEGGNTAVIFRIRHRDDIAIDQRVLYEGKALNIRDIKELGRRKGHELRCEEVRS
ncbi:MAG TPA: head-tail adaptor protein [Pelagibacterium sp.]|uniref:phage head closure protein n=1 Tax=uncultured Pelagibacterium sp. TaxID=1159875 RepID=UPI000C61EF5F|nr:head-tail adaptor protein [Pelagibacterium sp.]HCO54685.1 head-tail adaptor protein [Pelagibacterium sp.]|tara:strand:+ start:1212 stop:1529 length:318 start_codon:yes stop_codon:yes gene_type:complete